MKAFFEEYGFVMLSAVVIVALISIATGLRETVKTGITGVMESFKTQIVTENGLTIPKIQGVE